MPVAATSSPIKPPKGKAAPFRAPPAAKVTAAKLARPKPAPLTPAQAARMDALRGVERDSRRAVTPAQLVACHKAMQVLNRPDPKVAPWPDESRAGDRITAVENRLLTKMGQITHATNQELSELLRVVRRDDLLRDTYPHNRRLKNVIAVVEYALWSSAHVPTAHADTDLLATCERYTNLSDAMNSPDHPEHALNFNEMTDYPKVEADEKAIEGATPQSIAGIAALAQIALRDLMGGISGNEACIPTTARVILERMAKRAGPDAFSHFMTPAQQDATGIAACGAYRATLDTYLARPDADGDEGPTWDAYSKVRDIISDFRPRTLAGLVAKARACQEERVERNGTIGSIRGTVAEHWATDLVEILAAMDPRTGRSEHVVAKTPCPVEALTPLLADARKQQAAIARGMVTSDRKQLYAVAEAREAAAWELVRLARPSSRQGALVSLIGGARLAEEILTLDLSAEQRGTRCERIGHYLSSAATALKSEYPSGDVLSLLDTYLAPTDWPLATEREVEQWARRDGEDDATRSEAQSGAAA